MILGIISIATAVIVTLLVATKVIKAKYYPLCIGIMALGLVYSTTLLGDYVVGSDIQGELFQSRNTLAYGWNFANANSYSIVTIIIAPWLSQLLQIDIVWIYKAILPLFLAGVPVILHFVFKRQFGAIRAYFASLFFIIMPVYFLEIAQIAKSMIAEFFYALVILAIVSKWKWQWKAIAITACSIMTILCHYTIGIILIANLGGIFIIRLATNWSKYRLFAIRRIPILMLPAILFVCTIVFYGFFGLVNNGILNHAVNYIMQSMTEAATKVAGQFAGQTVYFATPEPLVQAGIGKDFMFQSIDGQLFRIVQYLTQALIAIGGVYLLFRPHRYSFTTEFVGGIACSYGLLFLCIFLPGFSNLINLTRFYQASLFFLAPMLIVGIDTVLRTIKWALK